MERGAGERWATNRIKGKIVDTVNLLTSRSRRVNSKWKMPSEAKMRIRLPLQQQHTHLKNENKFFEDC